MLHIGALLDRAPGRKYVAALRFAELAPRPPLPRANTLANTRKHLPDALVLALRAPRSAVVSSRGPLRVDAELEAGLDWLIRAADALQARAVVIHTPSELTPGGRSKDLLRAYAAQLPRAAERHYVWVPQGAWEVDEVQALCDELGLVRGFDPLETQCRPNPVVYATLRALGHRAGFSYSALSDALGRVLEHSPEEAFVSVDADRGFDIARRLQTIAAEELGETGALAEQLGAVGSLSHGGEDQDGEPDDSELEADFEDESS